MIVDQKLPRFWAARNSFRRPTSVFFQARNDPFVVLGLAHSGVHAAKRNEIVQGPENGERPFLECAFD